MRVGLKSSAMLGSRGLVAFPHARWCLRRALARAEVLRCLQLRLLRLCLDPQSLASLIFRTRPAALIHLRHRGVHSLGSEQAVLIKFGRGCWVLSGSVSVLLL